MRHVPNSEIVLPESLHLVSKGRKIKCPLCGKESQWLEEMEETERELAREAGGFLRMRRLALALYFATDAETYAHEFEQVLALPL